MQTLIEALEAKVLEAKDLLEHAYADGNSDSDYFEGLVDGYEVSAFMAQRIMEGLV